MNSISFSIINHLRFIIIFSIDENFPVLVVACSLTHEEILQDWKWLHSNLMDTLKSFENNEEDITDFVCCKIQSVIANNVPDSQFADGKHDFYSLKLKAIDKERKGWKIFYFFQ